GRPILDVDARRQLPWRETLTHRHEDPKHRLSAGDHVGVARRHVQRCVGLHELDLHALVDRDLLDGQALSEPGTSVLPEPTAAAPAARAAFPEPAAAVAGAAMLVVRLRSDAGVAAELLAGWASTGAGHAHLTLDARVVAGAAMLHVRLSVDAGIAADRPIRRARAAAVLTRPPALAGVVA